MFYNQLQKIAKKKKSSVSSILQNIGLNKSMGTYYKRGTTKPTSDVLIKLSIIHNISIEWLLEEEIQNFKEEYTNKKRLKKIKQNENN